MYFPGLGMESFLGYPSIYYYCISGLPFTKDNYENALNLLKHRYGNNQDALVNLRR